MFLFVKYYEKFNSVSNLPMDRWDKIHKTNQLKYLFKKDVNVLNNETLQETWAKIYNEYLIEFGLSPNYKQILKLKREIAIKQADFINSGDRILLTYINIDKENLRILTKPNGKISNFKDNIINIEKIQGVKINPLTITVLEYYTYLNNLSNG